MSITIPQTITKDWRSIDQEDATANRRIAIKNIQRETREMAPQWKKSQQKLYGSMLDITPDVSLGQVIIMNEGLSSLDLENNVAITITELTNIADRPLADYIVDRLEPSEILYLVVNLKGIVRNIKKNKSRLDKDMFIEIIKQMATDNPIDVSVAENDSDEAAAAAAAAVVSKKQIPLDSFKRNFSLVLKEQVFSVFYHNELIDHYAKLCGYEIKKLGAVFSTLVDKNSIVNLLSYERLPKIEFNEDANFLMERIKARDNCTDVEIASVERYLFDLKVNTDLPDDVFGKVFDFCWYPNKKEYILENIKLELRGNQVKKIFKNETSKIEFDNPIG